MKRRLRLLAFGTVLAAMGAMAQSSTDFNFSFPQYAFVYTNLSSVDFDFTASGSGANPGQAPAADGVATQPNLEACIESILSTTVSSGSFTANDTAAGTTAFGGSCTFAPTNVTRSGFTVDWGGLASPDGSLLVVTNMSTWAAKASLDAANPFATGGLTLQVYDGTNYQNVTTTPVNVGVMNGTRTNAFYTQYANAYVVPLTYQLVLDDPIGLSPTTNDSATVIYTVGAP
ncbi:hypothetical protein [Marinithermus hydrothermalis]|nr:hypothetical protein [Marinithermus hydrothermalis]